MACDIKDRGKNILLEYMDILEIEDICAETNENRILPLIFMGVISAVCEEAGIPETEHNEVIVYCLSKLLGQDIEATKEYVGQANVHISCDMNSFHAIAFCQGKNSYSDFLGGNTFAVFDEITSIIDYIESEFFY